MPPLFLTPSSLPSSFSWRTAVEALEAGHKLPRPRLDDSLITRDSQALLSRAAWIDGLGMALKSVSVFPDNRQRNLDTVQGAVLLFDDASGALTAVLDGIMVTDHKTAADSALCARLLARPESSKLLIVGAGRVAGNLARAYSSVLENIRKVRIWNRTQGRAESLAEQLRGEGIEAAVADDLDAAAGEADVIAAATMAEKPVLRGESVQPGTHVDLVGAYTPTMREADDALLKKARIFADCRRTAMDTGELAIPLRKRVIKEEDITADLYAMIIEGKGRTSADEITVCKNGGGAHLDLMIAGAMLDAAAQAS